MESWRPQVISSSSPVVQEGEEQDEEPGSPQSFTSDTNHPTYQYRHFYENIAPWDTTDDEWMVDELDVMNVLKEFRDPSVQLAKTQGNISDIRILSLYSIFSSNQERNESVTKYMPLNEHDIARNQLCHLYGKHSIPNVKSIMWCTQLSTLDGDWLEVKEKRLEYTNEAKGNSGVSLKLSSYVLFDLAPKLVRPENPSENAEDSSVHNYLSEYLDNIFSTER